MAAAVEDELAERRKEAAAAGADEGAVEDDGTETGAEPLGAGAVEGDEPDEAAREPEPPRLLQEALPGDWKEISGDFGGALPETAEIRLLGGKMPIEGSFAKGTEIDLLVRVKVTGVLGQDVLDDWGRTTRTVRRHMARLISVRRVSK